MINTKSFAKQRIWSRSETSANNRSRTSVCLNLFSSVYSVILMGFLMIINHSVCFLVWYVTYQYISHLGCLNFLVYLRYLICSFQRTISETLCFAVEIKGFEPLTPCLQGRCSPNWAIPPYISNNTNVIQSILIYVNRIIFLLNLAATYFPIPSPA